MSTLSNRSHRIVTDSEDDVDPRQRRKRDLKMSEKAAPDDDDLSKSGKKGDYRHTHPIHTETKPSVLSKEAPPENYSGFLRLGMLILAASNVRLIIENYVKYGLLLKVPGHDVPSSDYIMFGVAWISVPITLLVAFGVEWVMSQLAKKKKSKSEKPGDKLFLGGFEIIASIVHAVNLLFLMIYPSYIIYRKIYYPMVGMFMLGIALILLMKLISYSLVNRDLRALFVQNKLVTEYDVAYPDNITPGNLAYFWFAPTLCYQPSYPRTEKFRLIFFLKRVGEVSCAVIFMYFLTEQYAVPTLENSIKAMHKRDLIIIVERVLKLSTTAVIIWLLMFYALFHSFLNALSEVLRFGDRTFYLAWWNSGTLASYWRLWNRPVYLFFKRHVFLPSVNIGIPPAVASVSVFLISAVLHEALVGIPTHALTGFAFWGMLGQIPLIAFTEPLEKWRGKGTGLGNTIFWISFCIVGQPTVAIFYYYQWAINRAAIATSMGVNVTV